GLYNFPSLGDGPQVISLDPVSLPSGYSLTDGGRKSGESWTRLLRTPIGGGTLLRQNFILRQPATPSMTSAGNPPSFVSTESKANGVADGPGTTYPSPSNSETTSATQANLSGQNDGQRTFEIAAADNLEPVAAGEIKIISPAPNSVSMS